MSSTEREWRSMMASYSEIEIWDSVERIKRDQIDSQLTLPESQRTNKNGINGILKMLEWSAEELENRGESADSIRSYVSNVQMNIEKYSGSKSSGSSGCYIATCVYGSYDCPEVWTLRRFRDDTLLQSRIGIYFVKVYYMLSPTFVSLFGKTRWFKSITKYFINKLVNKLQYSGVESTPYIDMQNKNMSVCERNKL